MKKFYDRFKRFYTSPKTNKRACLCKDGNTYSLKCCDGSYQAQGIGKIWKYNKLKINYYIIMKPEVQKIFNKFSENKTELSIITATNI